MEQRAAWAKEHGLPEGFLLVTAAEMAHINHTVQTTMSDNLKWRAAARLIVNAHSQEELVKTVQRLQRAYADLSTKNATLRQRLSSQET